MAKRLCFAVIFLLPVMVGLTAPLCGQETRTGSEDRLAGKVQKVDRDNSLILVSYEKVTRRVIYNESTKFTVLNQPGSIEAVKEGRPVICRGKFDWRNRMVANRVEVPEKEE